MSRRPRTHTTLTMWRSALDEVRDDVVQWMHLDCTRLHGAHMPLKKEGERVGVSMAVDGTG